MFTTSDAASLLSTKNTFLYQGSTSGMAPIDLNAEPHCVAVLTSSLLSSMWNGAENCSQECSFADGCCLMLWQSAYLDLGTCKTDRFQVDSFA